VYGIARAFRYSIRGDAVNCRDAARDGDSRSERHRARAWTAILPPPPHGVVRAASACATQPPRAGRHRACSQEEQSEEDAMLRTEKQTNTAMGLLITLLMTAAAVTLGSTSGDARGSSTFDVPRPVRVAQRTAPAPAQRPGIARGDRAPKDGLLVLMLLAQGTRPSLSR
jgi:hypothetical protein